MRKYCGERERAFDTKKLEGGGTEGGTAVASNWFMGFRGGRRGQNSLQRGSTLTPRSNFPDLVLFIQVSEFASF